jgi:hypothetical protein
MRFRCGSRVRLPRPSGPRLAYPQIRKPVAATSRTASRLLPRRNVDERLGELVGVAGAFVGHSETFRTSPRRMPSLSGSRCIESTATWSEGITFLTALTADLCATAAAQSDLLPSGAITSTTGIPIRTFGILPICNWESQQSSPLPSFWGVLTDLQIENLVRGSSDGGFFVSGLYSICE